MQKEFENLDFFQRETFELVDSLKNNGTKYLLIFDNSCGEVCLSKAFVEIAASGRYRGLHTFCIKQNLFHQSQFETDFALQVKHIVLFKFPPDVVQISTLSAQLGLKSELADWYPEPTSVPYGQYLIDLSPRADDRLRFCTNIGSIPSKFQILDGLKQ